ncbi:hypothetical protein GIB67_017443 [Kingdonia uniflora]|uniref:ABC transporter domain-containing protein n=1 Tax=Kingdonia uniflora TaxID=39325 RepID=A0A7J7M4G0_9MAGN|nr:hypothetical protein GIB67_017443 [Kingdonia uniflora]
MEFKSMLIDPKHSLSSWELWSSKCNNWTGLTCENRTGRVISLNLSNMGLSGPVHPSLCKLSSLQTLVLSNNNFSGSIPICVPNLGSLKTLDLGSNLIQGEISEELFSGNKGLSFLDLSNNLLFGTLPCFSSLGDSLNVLNLSNNSIVGGIPTCISSLRALAELNLSRNQLKYGVSPIMRFSDKLVVLDLSHNGLSGMFPRSVSEMLGLVLLDLSYNLFVGGIPVEITELKGLQGLFLSNNMLTGEIPVRIGNLTYLQVIDLSGNGLSGSIPLNIVGCFQLLELKLNNNNLSGAIQPEFDALDSLKVLDISNNMFSGEIPLTLAGCKSLEVVDLSFNNLSGEVNESILKWSNLRFLSLARNNFNGIIPSWLFSFKQIQYIDLSGNDFFGFIPQGNFNISSIFSNASNNGMPSAVKIVDEIVVFVNVLENKDLGFNYKLLSSIGIDLSDNSLHGEIPDGLFRLQGLEYLNLSHNYLTGQIPESLESLWSLKTLDLSYNSLTGKIPANMSRFSGAFSGNPELCVEFSGEGCRFPVASRGMFGGEKEEDGESLVSCWAFWISALFSKKLKRAKRDGSSVSASSMSFSNINYYVDMPLELKQQGVQKDRLQLLVSVSGSFRPGVLTALVGVSGAGKTTLMDVLAGRKTSGFIEGYIFPGITKSKKLLQESLGIVFVDEVMELVVLTSLSGALVGLLGVDGLSTEQRKRLTIAVELVANPSIVFKDEPTSGLDARAAAIVMRTVRNIVNTGRTIVCTIHQLAQIFLNPLMRYIYFELMLPSSAFCRVWLPFNKLLFAAIIYEAQRTAHLRRYSVPTGSFLWLTIMIMTLAMCTLALEAALLRGKNLAGRNTELELWLADMQAHQKGLVQDIVDRELASHVANVTGGFKDQVRVPNEEKLHLKEDLEATHGRLKILALEKEASEQVLREQVVGVSDELQGRVAELVGSLARLEKEFCLSTDWWVAMLVPPLPDVPELRHMGYSQQGPVPPRESNGHHPQGEGRAR